MEVKIKKKSVFGTKISKNIKNYQKKKQMQIYQRLSLYMQIYQKMSKYIKKKKKSQKIKLLCSSKYERSNSTLVQYKIFVVFIFFISDLFQTKNSKEKNKK